MCFAHAALCSTAFTLFQCYFVFLGRCVHNMYFFLVGINMYLNHIN